jgi:hypothetical protein
MHSMPFENDRLQTKSHYLGLPGYRVVGVGPMLHRCPPNSDWQLFESSQNQKGLSNKRLSW